MRKSANSIILLICLIGAGLCLTYEESKLMSMSNHNLIASTQQEKDQEPLSDLEILQQYYNGYSSALGLPAPSYIKECYPAGALTESVAYIPTFLKMASSVSTINQAFISNQTFNYNLAMNYPALIPCLNGNPEVAQISKALGVTDPAAAQAASNEFIKENLLYTTNQFGDSYKDWISASYFNSGAVVASWSKLSVSSISQKVEEEESNTISQDSY